MKSKRFVLERERPPRKRPRWWKGMWLVRDAAASDRAVVERFWAHGPAERRVRCLNGELGVLACRASAPAASHAERWSLAS